MQAALEHTAGSLQDALRIVAVNSAHNASRALSKWFKSGVGLTTHAAIYVLIAGSYTPFTLVVLSGAVGWIMFAASWGMAAIGIVLKLFFTGRFNLISTLMYVLMGWVMVFAIKPPLNKGTALSGLKKFLS